MHPANFSFSEDHLAPHPFEHFVNRRGAAQRQRLLCTVEVSHNRIGDGTDSRFSNRESLQHPLENSQNRRGAPSLDTHPSKDQSNFRVTRESEGLGEADTLVRAPYLPGMDREVPKRKPSISRSSDFGHCYLLMTTDTSQPAFPCKCYLVPASFSPS